MWDWKRAFRVGDSPRVEKLRFDLAMADAKLEALRLAQDQHYANLQDKATGCKLEVYKDKAGEFHWRLKSRNHCIIAEGGEGYKRFENLEKSLNLVIDIIGTVEIHRGK